MPCTTGPRAEERDESSLENALNLKGPYGLETAPYDLAFAPGDQENLPDALVPVRDQSGLTRRTRMDLNRRNGCLQNRSIRPEVERSKKIKLQFRFFYKKINN